MPAHQANHSAPQTQFLGRNKKQNCCAHTCGELEPKICEPIEPKTCERMEPITCEPVEPITCARSEPITCGRVEPKPCGGCQETTSSSSSSCSSESEQDPCKGRHRRRVKDKFSKAFSRKQRNGCCQEEDTSSTSISDITAHDCCTPCQQPACNLNFTNAIDPCGGAPPFYKITSQFTTDSSRYQMPSVNQISNIDIESSEPEEHVRANTEPKSSRSTRCPSSFKSLTAVSPSTGSSSISECREPSRSSSTSCALSSSEASRSSIRPNSESSTQVGEASEQTLVCPESTTSSSSKYPSSSTVSSSGGPSDKSSVLCSSRLSFCRCLASMSSETVDVQSPVDSDTESVCKPDEKSSTPSRRC